MKEQGPCVYANELADRGFVVLIFDQSYMGESGGEPRNIFSPEIFSENFSAAIDYLGTKVSYVDRESIGVIGICGSGGFSLSAAQVDVRIKAVATCSMYDMSVAGRNYMTPGQILEAKKSYALKRYEDAENGYPEYNPFFPDHPLDSVPESLDDISKIWFAFYATKRGFHINARGGFTTTSAGAFLNYRLLDYINEISPRPILFVIGEQAHSKQFSVDAYNAANEPKELYVVKDANHIDLYDDTTKIPFDKLESFFKENL